MIRVVLADDHAVVRAGLAQLLATDPEIEVVGAAAGGEEAVKLTAMHSPDVVLMDLSMPGYDGIEATREIAAAHPGLPVVILTSYSDRERVLEAIDAGAAGYMLKDADRDELIRSVHEAAAGGSPLAPSVANIVMMARSARPAGDGLTPRETEVVKLVAAGLSNRQIALRLGISEKTVKAHLTHTYQRLGVADRTQAAIWAYRQGIA